MPFARRVALPALLLLLTSACPRRPPSPTSLLEDAAEDSQRSDASARTLALAGFHSWLVKGSADQARAHFDLALAKDPTEPWAHYGQLLLARRIAHPERAVESALHLVTRAPSHALAASASRYLLEQSGVSVDLDTRISEGVTESLAAGARGEIAHLLRTTLAAIHANRLDDTAHARVVSEMGAANAWTLAGPFSPFHVLDFDTPVPPEIDGSLAGPFTGPYGRILPRTLRPPDGRASLEGEAEDGNIYVLATDVEVSAPSQYIVRSVSLAAHKVFLDGTLLHQRRSFARAESTVGARAVWLEAGRHRLLVKISRQNGASLSLAVMRVDGAPAGIRFSPAVGPASSWRGVSTLEVAGVWPRAEDLARLLAREAGDGLASFVAIRDGMGRDADGAWRLMESLGAHLPTSSAVTALRADLAIEDRSLPSRISHARATRDLEATLEREPRDVSALLSRARLALEDGRHAEALELVKRARAAQVPPGFPVPLLRARVDLSMGLDALAAEDAAEALSTQPGLCEARWLLYDLARRRDAIAVADDVMGKANGCPGARTRRAEHARARGRIDEAIALYEAMAARDPAHLGARFSVAQLYVSAGRWEEAQNALQGLREAWPRSAEVLRRLADVYEHAGQRERALSTREEALRYAGGDLTLRRQVHRARRGREPLSEFAIDSRAAIDRYEAQPGTEDAASAMVLDAAAVEAFSDGSMVDRIHV
ncbi:MAG TPA: tetratricopeptide repeat protein, partial [Myxococcaceae bacterium]|nr:tetratricopeptide repeat protein [Myxococcaceae bacterium]